MDVHRTGPVTGKVTANSQLTEAERREIAEAEAAFAMTWDDDDHGHAATASLESSHRLLRDIVDPPIPQSRSVAPTRTSREQERPRSLPVPSGQNTIFVNPCQQGNPLLDHFRSIRWEFGREGLILPDYVLGETICALFLSLRYHRLHPEYIYRRCEGLRGRFVVRVLLIQVDVDDHRDNLKEVAVLGVKEKFSVLLGWKYVAFSKCNPIAGSPEDCARYLETIKLSEKRPVDTLREKVHDTHLGRLTACLTSVRGGLNKADVLTLVAAFGSMAEIVKVATSLGGEARFASCPGIGPRKAKRIVSVLSQPFVPATKNKYRVLKEDKAHLAFQTRLVNADDMVNDQVNEDEDGE